jgi:hypothetical protein
MQKSALFAGLEDPRTVQGNFGFSDRKKRA